MSRATAAVLFDDGTVKWCLYNGTSDILAPKLFDYPQDAWQAYYDPDQENFPEPVGESRHVVIYSDYGSGFYWEGTAVDNRVVDPFEPDEESVRGRPDWYLEAFKKAMET